MEDRQGLAEDYKNYNSVYAAGDTLYVAGTKPNFQDVWDDLKIPLRLTNRTQRYSDAARVLKAMPQIRRVVGHSLGGAVTLELQKAHPELKTVTYGAPVISASGGERHRALFDPIAMFDFGAKTELSRGINPHGYSGLAHGCHAFAKNTSKDGYTNSDQSSSMYRR